MDVIKNFDNLKGWISYKLSYSDGSEGVEQFVFEDFWKFRYYLGQHFLKELKDNYDYDDITLVEVHFESEDNNFHLHITDGYFKACCHNEIDNELIDKNYTKQMNSIKKEAKKARDILNGIVGEVE